MGSLPNIDKFTRIIEPSMKRFAPISVNEISSFFSISSLGERKLKRLKKYYQNINIQRVCDCKSSCRVIENGENFLHCSNCNEMDYLEGHANECSKCKDMTKFEIQVNQF